MSIPFAGTGKISGAMLAGFILFFVSTHQAESATKPAPNAVPFDHSQTGFLLKDVHTTLKCEQCHVDGIFKNTPKDCAGCHTTGTRVAATPKPINHVPTTSGCDTCHISAANFLVKSFKHVGITGGCATCHNGQSLGVVSKPANHFPTSLPCESCHTNTSSFQSSRMDHTGVTTGCALCHQGQFVGIVGVPAIPTAHIPIQPGQECNACHFGFTTFLGAVYNHSGIGGARCDSCHNGRMPGVVSAPPIPSRHISIPPGQDCNSCHLSTSTFLGATYSHPAPVPVCDTCHTGAYPGVKTKSATHIPTLSATCNVCHTAVNTVGYTSFLGAVYHATVTPAAGSCATCHNGAYTSSSAQGMVAGHIPTSGAACDQCHTASNTGLFSSFTGAVYHASVSATPGSCNTCHSGAYTLTSGNGLSPSPVDGGHIPLAGLPCSQCHTSSNTAQFTTFLGAKYHINVVTVAGTCGNAGCHDGVSTTSGALGKSAALGLNGTPHVITTAACDTCHTQAATANYTTFLGAIVDHSLISPPVAGRCSTCHNGTAAKGKSPTSHLPTTAECDTCHTRTNTQNYTTFLGAGYHSTTTVAAGSCGNAGCHGTALGLTNGALGVPTGHIPFTGTTCDSGGCHSAANTASYSTFVGASYHPGAAVAAGSCFTCHNGAYMTFTSANGNTARTTPTPHPTSSTAPTTCDAAGCHTTATTASYSTWTGAKFHPTGAVIAGTCGTNSGCHGTPNGYNAQNKVAGHVSTTAACDSCHTNTANYTTWLGASYTHDAAAVGICQNCHNGTRALGKATPHIPATGSCDAVGCHSGAAVYSAANVAIGYPGAWAGATYAPHPASSAGTCSTCHSGTYPGVSSKTFNPGPGGLTSIPGGHQVTSAQCDVCHTAAVSGYLTTSPTWAGAGYDHTSPGTTGNCGTSSCHGPGGNGKGVSANHYPVGNLTCDSGGCHKVLGGAVTSFAGGVWNHSVAPMSAVRCDACHNGAYTTFGTYGAVPKVSNHIPTAITGTLDCNTCHKGTPPTTAATSGAGAWAKGTTVGEVMNHNGAQGGAPNYCVTCHLSGTTYLVPSGFQRKSHNGSSTAKDCSRSSCHRPLGNIGATYSTWN